MADINDQTQNVNIWNDDKSKAVSVITDGAVERLAVDVNSGEGVQLQLFKPHFDFDTSLTALSQTVDTELFSTSNQGKIDFITVNQYRLLISPVNSSNINILMKFN